MAGARAPHAVALHRSWKRRIPVLFVALALFGSVILHKDDQPFAVHAQVQSVVQAAGARVQAVSNSSTGTGTVTVTFAAAGAGNLLVVCAANNEVVADRDFNTPAGWSAISLADINATTKVRGRMFFKVAAGGETSVICATTSGTNDVVAYMMEFSGTATSSPEDQAAENTGTTSPSVTGTMGSPVAGAIGVAFVAINNTNNLTTPAGGYTLEGTVVSGNATPANACKLAMLYDVSSPSTASGVTQGGTARSYVAQIVSFKPSAGTTFNQTLAVSGGTWTTAMTRSTGKILAVTATCTATMVRRTNKVLAVAGTFTAALVKSVTHPLAVTGTWTVAAVKLVGKPLSVGATFTAAMVRRTGKVLASAAAWTAQMVRQTGKSLAVSTAWTTALAASKAFLKTLSVTVTFTASVGRRISKTLSAVGSWVAGLVATPNFPSYFLPPVVEFLHSSDRYNVVMNEKDEMVTTRSAYGRYRLFYRGPVAQQRLTDAEGYYSVGSFQFRGGVWNGPLSGAQIAAITSAGLDGRIRQASDPGHLPASIDP